MIDSSLAAVARSSAWATDPPERGGLLSLHKHSVAPAGFLPLCEAVVNLILAQTGLCCNSSVDTAKEVSQMSS